MPSDTSDTNLSYNARYYREHKKEIFAKRAERYRTDPVFKEQMLSYERAWRAKKRQRVFEEAKAALKPLSVNGIPHKVKPCMVDGKPLLLRSPSVLASLIGYNARTVSFWVDHGILPPATFVSQDGRRWFSDSYIAMAYAASPWLVLGVDEYSIEVKRRFKEVAEAKAKREARAKEAAKGKEAVAEDKEEVNIEKEASTQ